MIYIPEKFLVGFQRKVNSYGHAIDTDRDNEYILGFATYKDEKGNIRQEQSWQSWKREENPILTFDNNLTSGFKIIGHEQRGSVWTSSGRSVFCVEDPRGFVLQINSGNLVEIIKQCQIINGVIQQKCVWSWDKKNVLLVPEGTDLYKEGIESFRLKKQKVSLSQVKPGYKIRLQTGEIGTWLGSIWTISNAYYAQREINEKIIDNKPKKRQVFLTDQNELKLGSSFTIAEILDTSNTISNIVDLLNEQINIISKQEFENKDHYSKNRLMHNGWKYDYNLDNQCFLIKSLIIL